MRRSSGDFLRFLLPIILFGNLFCAERMFAESSGGLPGDDSPTTADSISGTTDAESSTFTLSASSVREKDADAIRRLDAAIAAVESQIASARNDLKEIGTRAERERAARRKERDELEKQLARIRAEIRKTREQIEDPQDGDSREFRLKSKIYQQRKELRDLVDAARNAAERLRKETEGSLWQLADPTSFSRLKALSDTLGSVREKMETARGREQSLQNVDRIFPVEQVVSSRELSNTLRELFALLRIQRRIGRTAARFRASVVLPDDTVESLECLRIGNLIGYCRIGEEDGAILLKDPDTHRWTAVNSFLSKKQRGAIANMVKDPVRGGILPVDVTGGMALYAAKSRQSWREWFRAGGLLMVPIAAVALLAVIAVFYRLVILLSFSLSIRKTRREVFRRIDSGDISAVSEWLEHSSDPLAMVLSRGFALRFEPLERMETVLHEGILAQTPRLRQLLTLLAVLAGIAPLLGLLGTVTGMINTFRILTVTGVADPRALSGGISEALITTQAGLMVAIPIILLHGFLARIASMLIETMHLSAVTLVNRLHVPPEPPGLQDFPAERDIDSSAPHPIEPDSEMLLASGSEAGTDAAVAGDSDSGAESGTDGMKPEEGMA